MTASASPVNFDIHRFMGNVLKSMAIDTIVYRDRSYDLTKNEFAFTPLIALHAQSLFTQLTGLDSDQSWIQVRPKHNDQSQEPMQGLNDSTVLIPDGESSLGLFLIIESIMHAKSQQTADVPPSILNINCLSILENTYLLSDMMNAIAPRIDGRPFDPNAIRTTDLSSLTQSQAFNESIHLRWQNAHITPHSLLTGHLTTPQIIKRIRETIETLTRDMLVHWQTPESSYLVDQIEQSLANTYFSALKSRATDMRKHLANSSPEERRALTEIYRQNEQCPLLDRVKQELQQIIQSVNQHKPEVSHEPKI